MSYLTGKTVLITGAGGSIGAELCRRAAEQNAHRIIMFENSELALYNIDRQLNRKNCVPVLGDVSNINDVAWVFSDYSPDIVYHTAAYKHVTLCEKNPAAARRVNVYGTKLLTQQATWYESQFILISTDKAVNPTCVMGDSKREAEEIVRSAHGTIVRLGNVWGSSGSVVPLWKEQIAAGRPVTITDPVASRYWIPLSTAVYRIIEASEIAQGGETFVPDMGQPQILGEVALRLGAKEFNVIGLRPGEKLHEELFQKQKSRTLHPMIYRDAA